VALITLGEGWHNLHHAFQGSVRQGITVEQGAVVALPDPTYAFIELLERAGWASRLRRPTEQALLARANKEGIYNLQTCQHSSSPKTPIPAADQTL
jgi:stearoyl-CoA desaturase (delta-9 desaturase)